jgi:hypothetical protein
MSIMTAASGTATTGRLKSGLALSALLGAANIPFAFMPTPDGQDGPPIAVSILNAVIGLVSVVCAVVAWSAGNRLAIRINAAALIINGLLSVPALFVDIDAWIKVVAATGIVLTVVALVLTLRRERTPYTVTD